MTVIAELEFELAYFEAAVQNISHYTMQTPPQIFIKLVGTSGGVMTVIAELEFELAYFEAAVQNISHYTTQTPPQIFIKLVGTSGGVMISKLD